MVVVIEVVVVVDEVRERENEKRKAGEGAYWGCNSNKSSELGWIASPTHLTF